MRRAASGTLGEITQPALITPRASIGNKARRVTPVPLRRRRRQTPLENGAYARDAVAARENDKASTRRVINIKLNVANPINRPNFSSWHSTLKSSNHPISSYLPRGAIFATPERAWRAWRHRARRHPRRAARAKAARRLPCLARNLENRLRILNPDAVDRGVNDDATIENRHDALSSIARICAIACVFYNASSAEYCASKLS